MKLRGPWNAVKFISSLRTGGLARNTQLHGDSLALYLEQLSSLSSFQSELIIILLILQSVPFLGREISLFRGLLHTQNNTNMRTIMPWMRFEPTIPAFEPTNTFRALDSAINANGFCMQIKYKDWLSGLKLSVKRDFKRSVWRLHATRVELNLHTWHNSWDPPYCGHDLREVDTQRQQGHPARTILLITRKCLIIRKHVVKTDASSKASHESVTFSLTCTATWRPPEASWPRPQAVFIPSGQRL
jgi:hypothetical protein